MTLQSTVQLAYLLNSVEVNIAIAHDYEFVLYHVNENEDDNRYDLPLID